MLFLFAVGFFFIHRTANFFNVAHGDYVTLGAYFVWTFTTLLGWNIWVALPVAMVSMGLIAIFIDGLSYRYLRGAPLALLLCSMGVGLIVRHGIYMTWGGAFRTLKFRLPTADIAGTVVSGSLILALVFVGIIVLAAFLLLAYTSLGMSVRAMADNLSLAETFGIDTEKTLRIVWFFSGCTAALGGFVVLLYQPLTYDVGFMWILLIFAVSILAGAKISLPRLLGACAVIAGGMEAGLFFVPEAYRTGIGFSILILAIVVRRILGK
jgi:branched-subunit amino acid ABC-type transport system permease component